MTMNSFANKEYLARIRGGDFAHPGEEEAIDLVLSYLRPRSGETVLDAGCGRGATADAIRKKTSADVIGVDLDAQSIGYAKATYPGTRFEAADITMLGEMALPKIGAIYAFNSLYACADLDGCFSAFRRISNAGARAGVFDYIAYDADALADSNCLPSSVHTTAEMRQIPERHGWACTGIVNLDLDYAIWYRRFLSRMDENRAMLSAVRTPDFFDEVRKTYADMLRCLEQGTLGAALHTYVHVDA
ncbi:MAG: methyltransferase domain-containing protein [Hyphomicrobiaceae bacterium]|nr:methyltransferase domain-containing protein [Hyphomicrobiaceae bacterium]